MTRTCLVVVVMLLSISSSASTSLSRFLCPCLPCNAPAGPLNDEEASLIDSAASESNPPNPCVVCFEQPSNTYNTACGHLGMCNGCSQAVRQASGNCPICRIPFTNLKTVALSPGCVLCKKNPPNAPNTLNEKCNHLCMCNECVDENIATLAQCPHCQAAITRLVEVYLPELSL